MVVHSADKKPFKCPHCILRYSYKSHLKQHIENNHVINENNAHYYCSICNITFVKKSQLSKHNYCHTGQKAYECYYPFCEKSYFNEGKLKLHILKNHNNSTTYSPLTDNNLIAINSSIPINNLNSENISTCLDNSSIKKVNSFNGFNRDSKEFINVQSDLSYRNEKEDKSVCEDSNNSEDEENKSLKFLLDEKEESYKINKDYLLDNNKLIYKDLVSKNNNNVGQIITKSNNFLQRKKMKNFINTTFSQKDEKTFYKCPIKDCLKTYTTPYNLKVHVKTSHFKIQQYRCGVCAQTFSHKCSLNNHMLKLNHLGQSQEIKVFKDSKINVKDLFKNLIPQNSRQNNSKESENMKIRTAEKFLFFFNDMENTEITEKEKLISRKDFSHVSSDESHDSENVVNNFVERSFSENSSIESNAENYEKIKFKNFNQNDYWEKNYADPAIYDEFENDHYNPFDYNNESRENILESDSKYYNRHDKDSVKDGENLLFRINSNFFA